MLLHILKVLFFALIKAVIAAKCLSNLDITENLTNLYDYQYDEYNYDSDVNEKKFRLNEGINREIEGEDIFVETPCGSLKGKQRKGVLLNGLDGGINI